MDILMLVIGAMLIIGISSDEKASFLGKCSRSDPKLNECAKNAGNEAISQMTKGIKSLKIPPISPLYIEKITGEAGAFHFVMTEVRVYGLEKSKIAYHQIDFKTGKWVLNITAPNLQIICKYVSEGKLLFIPLNGKGDGNYTFVDGNYQLTTDFDVKMNAKDKKDHIVLRNPLIHAEVKRAYHYLSNLFNGNSQLSDQMNKVLDDNWMAVFDEMRPIIEDTISSVFFSILNTVCTNVPLEQIFIT